MEDALIEGILAVIAAALSVFVAWLNSKKKEAFEQGDKVLAAFGKMTDIASGLAVVFPQIKVEVDALKDMYNKFYQGWNDKKFTTDEMVALYNDAEELFNAVMAKVAKLKG